MRIDPRRNSVKLASALGCALLAAAFGCGGGGGGGGGGGPDEPAECANVAGTWRVTETAYLDCDENLDPFVPESVSGSGTVEIEQDGCKVSYRVPQLDVERRGVVGLDFIEMSGPLARVEGVRVIDNVLDVQGAIDSEQPSSFDVTGSGRLTLAYEGERGSCTATSSATFRR